jgi:hypothetical protein
MGQWPWLSQRINSDLGFVLLHLWAGLRAGLGGLNGWANSLI